MKKVPDQVFTEGSDPVFPEGSDPDQSLPDPDQS